MSDGIGSDRSLRDKVRLDYKKLHSVGERVEKEESLDSGPSLVSDVIMSETVKRLKVEEKRVRRELDELVEADLEKDFSEVHLLDDHISELTRLSRKFRDVHYSLEDELDDEAYAEAYPKFEETYSGFRDYIKKAKLAKTGMEKTVELREEQDRLRDQIDLVLCKIDGILGNPIESLLLIEDIRQNIREMSEQQVTCTHLVKKWNKLAKSEDPLHEECMKSAKAYVQAGKTKIETIMKATKDLESEQLKESKRLREEKQTAIDNQAALRQEAIVSRQLDEIMFVESVLIALKTVKVSEVTDEALLEMQKGLRDMYSKCDALSDKITQLHSQMPMSYKDRALIVEARAEKEQECRDSLKAYKEMLEAEVASRNVSKERLASNDSLKIDLGRFSGLDSVMDIYTFQTKFEKLFLSNITTKMLPDYLKYNHLEGAALTLVKGLDSMSEIWKRLKEAYGDTNVLLRSKLREVESLGPIWKCKDKAKLVQILSKLIYVMVDLQELAKIHKIENDLYHGGAIHKVYAVAGHSYRDKFIRKHAGSEMSKMEKWSKLIEYLRSELGIENEILLAQQDSDFKPKVEQGKDGPRGDQEKPQNRKSYNAGGADSSREKPLKCHLCGHLDHSVTRDHFGKRVVQYFACKVFAEMSCKDRFKLLQEKGLCYQCLSPGTTVDHGKHKDGTCFSKFACKHPSHARFPRKKHVLVCEEHKEEAENLRLLEGYRKEHISKFSFLPDYSKNIKLSFHCLASYVTKSTGDEPEEDEITDATIYTLQTIKVRGVSGEDVSINMFYDSGCEESCSSKQGADKLSKVGRAKNVIPGPMHLRGVSDIVTVSEHGVYKVTLVTHDGKLVTVRGLCLTNVTCRFPTYPLKEIEEDIRATYQSLGKSVDDLPRLSKYVGGETEIMLGSKYLKYHPKFVFEMPCGMRVYRSCFVSVDGTRGVIGGPHSVITELQKQLEGSYLTLGSYLSQQLILYRSGIQLDPEAKLIAGENLTVYDIETYECVVEEPEDSSVSTMSTCVNCGGVFRAASVKKSKLFEIAENAGSEVDYRCIKCRNCVDCKKSGEVQCISIQEEVEQDLVDKSVAVLPEKGMSVAKLPFLQDPETTLCTNKDTAMSVYRSQVRKLDRNPRDKQAAIESERKMQELGFVQKLENLSDEQIKMIMDSAVQYYIPWKAVFNPESVSTPCRLVFDASQVTPSGYSLNSIVAKGRNNMNKLVVILIRWFFHRCVFHTDIRKMYNSVRLAQEHWCYQLYLWHDELNPDLEPFIKVIMTLIYGVKSSGNQAESALRKVARLYIDKYPRACKALLEDTYVDDCLSGADSEEETSQMIENLQLALCPAGFTVKGFVRSGKDPPAELSKDGVTVKVGGAKWFSRIDKISLVSGDLNFCKKKKGRKTEGVPDNLTRVHCHSKVAELFDLTGLATPITCGWKIDLRTLVDEKLDWEDRIPSELKSLWLQNFETLQELCEVQFNRCVVPVDAVSLDVDTIEFGDASESLFCAAIYARFLRKDGSYSCQLIFSRSKLVPKGMSIPRAELLAAHLNATIGHVAHLAVGDLLKASVKLTDSQVSLFWIHSTSNPLKQWTRNKTVDIDRLAPREDWFYIRSADNIADMGTRKGASIEDISDGSHWRNGYKWMQQDRKYFPIVSVEEVKFQQTDIDAIKKESLRPEIVDMLFCQRQNPSCFMVDTSYAVRKVQSEALTKRYEFLEYIVDPNRYKLRKVVRVVALVMVFVRNFVRKWSKKKTPVLRLSDDSFSQFSKNILSDLSVEKYLVTCGNVYSVRSSTGLVSYFSSPPGLVVHLSEEDLNLALNYFYRKCTLEVKHFVDKKSYEKISVEKEGILYYSGRILPSQEFGGTLKLSDVMIDLTSTTFSVPLVDKMSPFAYALVNDVHWYSPVAKHSGNETVWRYVLKYAYIVDGKELVRSFRQDCTRCRYLAKRTVDVVMGPVSKVNLMLAPAFYISQVDICGPMKAYSVHNKRSSINVWFLVFCCCTTGAVSLKVMENYSTSAFMLGFIRFSCSVGYPKMLLPDEGSQLVRGCKEMQLSFSDIKQQLHVEYGVEFDTCPVGGHNMHGKIERKIQHIKQAMSKELEKERLSVLQWETVGDQIANCVNDTPLAMRYVPRDVEQIDLLTPNRLMLGRNNDRSPAGPLCTNFNPDKLIEQNERIMRAWFECWLISHVPKLIDRPKWFDSDTDVKVGDVVLFLKKDKEYAGNYQYGIVKELEVSKDGKTRKVIVEYVNSNEDVRRQTRRSVREIVVIHPIDELGIVRELGEIATWVDMKRKVSSSCAQTAS